MQKIIDEFSDLPGWKAYNLRHPERRREISRNYAKTHLKQLAEKQRRYRERNPNCWRKWVNENREKLVENQRRYRQNLKRKVLEVLGGECVRCGFSDPRALQVDHVHGGGKQERLQIDPMGFYRKVLKNPTNYQFLCVNCNWIKRHENREYYKMS